MTAEHILSFVTTLNKDDPRGHVPISDTEYWMTQLDPDNQDDGTILAALKQAQQIG